jgi:hypothetical protein
MIRTAVLAVAIASGVHAQGACDRACLTGYIDTYFKALAAGNPSALPMAANAKITVNGDAVPLAKTFWQGAGAPVYRWDIVNIRRGDTGTEAVIRNADGSKTMFMLRLKLQDAKITEVETIKCNKSDAGSNWDIDTLTEVSPQLLLSIPEFERDSYYDLIGAAEGYWRAFHTNGTPLYHPARLLPDSHRIENGRQTTGNIRNGKYFTTAENFINGDLVGVNIWDRRYPVVDEERGIVLSIARFAMKVGAPPRRGTTSNDRSAGALVGEFFAVKAGYIGEIQAVFLNRSNDLPSGWPADDGSPGPGLDEHF